MVLFKIVYAKELVLSENFNYYFNLIIIRVSDIYKIFLL